MPSLPERLRELFELRGETVIRRKTGEPIEFRPGAAGYHPISFDRTSIPYHRLKFFLWTGNLPAVVDHEDRDRTNNSLANLRAATHQESMRNRRAWGSLPRGVSLRPGKARPYRARVTINRKSVSLGYFTTPEDASEAVEAHLRSLHGEFYRCPASPPS